MSDLGFAAQLVEDLSHEDLRLVLGVFRTDIQGLTCAMAEAIRGTAEKFDLLARVKHLPFPGGAVRTPLLVAAMLFYRLRDALG